MAEMIAGFELREGISITDLDAWPSFALWWEQQYGFPPITDPDDIDFKVRETFEAYMAGAYWQWEEKK